MQPPTLPSLTNQLLNNGPSGFVHEWTHMPRPDLAVITQQYVTRMLSGFSGNHKKYMYIYIYIGITREIFGEWSESRVFHTLLPHSTVPHSTSTLEHSTVPHYFHTRTLYFSTFVSTVWFHVPRSCLLCGSTRHSTFPHSTSTHSRVRNLLT